MERGQTGSHPPTAHESMVGRLIAFSVTLVLVNVVIVALRFYVRVRVIRKFGLDDWALAATLVRFLSATITVSSRSTRLGLGVHIDVLSLSERSTLLQLIFVSASGYHFIIMLVKSTFLLQFRRVFPLPTIQRLCDIFLVFIALWAVAGGIGGVVVCLPLSKNWDPLEPSWTCTTRYRFWLGHGILHVVTDVLIFVMPLPLLKTLPLPPLHKAVLMGVFCLGFCTCVISAIRLTTLDISLRDPDVSWTSAITCFWSLGEVTSSILCLCIPTLRPLLGMCCCFSRRAKSPHAVDRGGEPNGLNLISLPSTASETRSPARTRTATVGPSNDRIA
ncbi:hypothetical protein C8A03DRAFT_17469 [Achaetomium macrosporum]|uniref:Rhodopsin domain-containing protein n=1 Tax=Achaetomium macrosporum TaxID=79813 RepID=A0AAN7C6T5_9PEZI|nr:hypothetical protein C8A03DRAFT_17469 [Achaetomium macrosporum]